VPDAFSDGSLESLSIVAAIAADSERLEVGAYMFNASLRDPDLVVRTVATLEAIAPGRIRVLLGTGWDRADYEALERERPTPRQRARRTKETLSALKQGTRASIEIAGVTDDVLRLAAAEADGWSLSADAIDAFFERVAFLREACDEVGRHFDDLRLGCTLPSGDRAAHRTSQLFEHGLGEVRVDAADAEAYLSSRSS
jgi:alkanesulfonate monooxygenase SsuD/methylene tetrahydromethanopterin reductase-like flavin-dependent oxidoreductase (luciferase family)